MSVMPESLRGLFWDTDFDRLDPARHGRFVAERLMEKTTPEAFRWLVEHCREDELLALATSSRRISGRSRDFWKAYLHAR